MNQKASSDSPFASNFPIFQASGFEHLVIADDGRPGGQRAEPGHLCKMPQFSWRPRQSCAPARLHVTERDGEKWRVKSGYHGNAIIMRCRL